MCVLKIMIFAEKLHGKEKSPKPAPDKRTSPNDSSTLKEILIDLHHVNNSYKKPIILSNEIESSLPLVFITRYGTIFIAALILKRNEFLFDNKSRD